MSDDIRSWIKEHHAFYEVLPSYVVLEERPVGRPATTRRVQAGFDIVSTAKEPRTIRRGHPHQRSMGGSTPSYSE